MSRQTTATAPSTTAAVPRIRRDHQFFARMTRTTWALHLGARAYELTCISDPIRGDLGEMDRCAMIDRSNPGLFASCRAMRAFESALNCMESGGGCHDRMHAPWETSGRPGRARRDVTSA